jgi:MFS family permease
VSGTASLSPAELRRRFLRHFPAAGTAIFLAALDQTIVATALPAIAAELGEVERLSWVVVAYLLATTLAVPVYGKLGDAFGRRRKSAAADRPSAPTGRASRCSWPSWCRPCWRSSGAEALGGGAALRAGLRGGGGGADGHGAVRHPGDQRSGGGGTVRAALGEALAGGFRAPSWWRR